ncbi:hypothetical protein LWI29_012127 [Acer saccharum]|uniref:Uncharacterized protein n=1 Tax=Acer saccharum TaxID=4024 RepID=A0AA39W2Q9_ACESA|nr:hypothetical protein LWI29_012127 [Acer saccharum]
MKAIELASGFSIADLYPSIRMLEVISGMKSKIENLHQERDRILGDIIDEHKERRQTTKTGQKEADEEDLIDVFLRLQEDGDLEFPLTNNNIKAVIWLLSANRVRSFRSIREEETSNVIKTIYSKEGSLVNLSEKIFASTYAVTARAAFGNKSKDQQKFILIVMKAIELASGFSIADLYPSIGILEVITGMKSKIEKLHQERDRILGDIIDEHKERWQTVKTGQKEADEEDLIDVFLRLQEDGDLEFPLTNNNIKAVIWVSLLI